ncbi:PREDICTED: polycystic kidney disease protein 1-like 1 [Nanorana parkeri]|uniref:polycystic kidney disease protein 1-like 1 n=1 Tax=Nanorana parkeri TaxID=125878 RepID=UPI000853FEE5|nr:PREDICTED: polycystic kidney disease protein 1-like 1 [Nanorana parkeri]
MSEGGLIGILLGYPELILFMEYPIEDVYQDGRDPDLHVHCKDDNTTNNTCFLQENETSTLVVTLFFMFMDNLHTIQQLLFRWKATEKQMDQRSVSLEWIVLDRGSLNVTTDTPGIYLLAVSLISPLHNNSFILSIHKQVKVVGSIDNVTAFFTSGNNYATLSMNADGSYSTQTLEFRVLTMVEANFLIDFGDGTTDIFLLGSRQLNGYGASAFHKYYAAGEYHAKVTAFNELFNATEVFDPFYVQVTPTGLSLMMNTSIVHKDDYVLFSATLRTGSNVTYTWNISGEYTSQEPTIIYRFSTVAYYNITVIAWNKLGRQEAWKIVNVLPKVKPLYILTNGTVFSTETDINFTAVTEEFVRWEFKWQFGDGTSRGITRKSIIKRYNLPNTYSVIVTASNKFNSFTSDVHTIFVQRKVIPNRLVASPSVVINSNVSFYCRINSGTNVSYFWNFGDGTKRLGKYNDTHVYKREGEYTVNVSIFNNVSSAFLTKQIFVVKKPCQPPPVKNMGPLKLQIRRYEDLYLGVTFEATVICNISQGLKYHWSFIKTDVTYIFLPARVENSKQTITLPAFSLDYGNYTALARVQIIGTVVYSNYTVAVEVKPTAPVSVIANGHHHYIDKNTVKHFILDGMASFDPDNPGSHLR